jgi:hypothetical protein
MIFLIEYDRSAGKLVVFKTFKNSQRAEAEKTRFETELDLNRKEIDHEVLLLEAPTEDALRRTHRRYFEDLAEISESAI